ncbi:hypothetical protein RHECNPAF_136002 [Rhizobium etli CNPAF512]|nr:hypothetical protein RHECNPAF_136002 [Rhizobium etli CNPAF512]
MIFKQPAAKAAFLGRLLLRFFLRYRWLSPSANLMRPRKSDL